MIVYTLELPSLNPLAAETRKTSNSLNTFTPPHTAHTTHAVNGFCDHNRTMSSINGNYSWEESTAGVTVTQACVLGTDVDRGKARRECGADAEWREPDFTQCIDSKSSICSQANTKLSETEGWVHGGPGDKATYSCHVASFLGPYPAFSCHVLWSMPQ